MNPLQLLNQVVQQYRILQGNQGEIGKLLLNNGRITQSQYEDIKDMTPSQMGNYLLNNGVLGQQQANQYSQTVPQVQQMLGNNN